LPYENLEVDVMAREMVLGIVLVFVLGMGVVGCAGQLGEGKVYGASYPALERADEPSAGGLAVYGFTYPRVDSVSAPAPDRRGLTVYGFQYPRND